MQCPTRIGHKSKGVGIVEDHFEIVTEHQILKVPVTCEIVTPLVHDPRHVNSGVKMTGYLKLKIEFYHVEQSGESNNISTPDDTLTRGQNNGLNKNKVLTTLYIYYLFKGST